MSDALAVGLLVLMLSLMAVAWRIGGNHPWLALVLTMLAAGALAAVVIAWGVRMPSERDHD